MHVLIRQLSSRRRPRRRLPPRFMLLLLLLLLAGCAANPARVPLYGDAATLAGEWSGQYVSDETGRTGTIVFRLVAGQDTARGDVVMLVPRSAQEAPGFVPPGGVMVQGLTATDARVLTIRFVEAEAGGVRGRLDPYTDPACNCRVETVFEGARDGNLITGSFVTRQLERPHVQRGRWQVRRKRACAGACLRRRPRRAASVPPRWAA